MGDRVLHIALCTSIFGLVLLTFVAEALEPPYSRIAEINTGFVGKNVHLQGEISDVHKFKGGSLLLKVSELNHSVDVFIPYGVSSQVDLGSSLRQKLDLIGVVEVYEGRLEIVVDKESNVRLVEDES